MILRRYLAAALLVIPCVVQADDWVMRRHVLTGGSGRVVGSQHSLGFTVGEQVLGSAQGDALYATFGFWGRRQFPIGTGIDDGTVTAPRYTFALNQNYPNPFNPSTTILYRIGEAKPAPVDIRIYDVSGRLIKVLVDEVKYPGEHRVIWDGRNYRGEQVSTGIYLYCIRAGEFTQSKKLLLLK